MKLKDQNRCAIVILHPNKRDYTYLKCYGPTKVENEWTEDKRVALVMPFNSLGARLPVVRQFFPTATYIFV